MGKPTSALLQAEREALWRERLTRHATSGQSIEAFCKAEGVAAWSFYHWRKQLISPQSAVHQSAAMPFIELEPVPGKSATSKDTDTDRGRKTGRAASLHVRIELGDGIVLQITRQ